jgi:hypothetical protein
MIGKAHLAVGHPELALEYGDECLAQCTEFGLVDFDLAYAHELRARGLWAVGRKEDAEAELAMAAAVPIADAEDQSVLATDLAIPLGT